MDARRGSAPAVLDGGGEDGGEPALAQFAAVKERYLARAGDAPKTPARERLDSELPPPGSASASTGLWLQARAAALSLPRCGSLAALPLAPRVAPLRAR
jgi:hypothetical protein